jgi:tRNA(adenine34) deaminase
MSYSDMDKQFMKIALKEARSALKNGDLPVGAVLVIDGKLIAKKRNKLYSYSDWISHAELKIIQENSKIIKEKIKTKNSNVELYTTVEPCLMCLGATILNRITRVVFSCPDPFGGATKINPKNLSKWYIERWPMIEGGLFKKESCDLIINFMKLNKSETLRKQGELFVDMRNHW